jgi:hypothetical protein
MNEGCQSGNAVNVATVWNMFDYTFLAIAIPYKRQYVGERRKKNNEKKYKLVWRRDTRRPAFYKIDPFTM